jgi:hypothetical protein
MEDEFFVCENIQPLPAARFSRSGKSAAELPGHRKRRLLQGGERQYD